MKNEQRKANGTIMKFHVRERETFDDRYADRCNTIPTNHIKRITFIIKSNFFPFLTNLKWFERVSVLILLS